MRKHFMILGVALLAVPGVASAQSGVHVQGSTKVRVEARGASSEQPQGSTTQGSAHGATRAEAHAAVRAAAKAGLPEAPIRRVVSQGEARGASEAQISQAAANVLVRLQTAREALKDNGERQPSEAEITAGAEALAAGATRIDLEQLSQAAPAGRSLVASLTTLAQLRASGAEASAAAEIAAGLSAGLSDGVISGLGGTVDATSQAGGSLGGGTGVVDAAVGGTVGATGTATGGGTTGVVGGVVGIGAGVAGSLRGGSR